MPKVAEFLAADGPVLLEVFMHPEQLFIPRVGTLKGENGTLISPPLEDMIPLVSEAAAQRRDERSAAPGVDQDP